MQKVKFLFEKEKDLWNIWDACNRESRWYDFKKNINQQILKICSGKKFEECNEELEKVMIKLYNSNFIEVFKKALENSWNDINEEFFRRLKKVTKKEFPFKEIKAYITTIGRSPYDWKEPSFMVSVFYSLPHAVEICGHELFHIHFHNLFWKKMEKKIKREKIENLKEALTILLDVEFIDLWFVKDKGYEPHKELRDFIKKIRNQKKDFDFLLEKCIEYLENEN